jgi:DNA repair exonuclease SbcCD nuclease subunit
MAYRFVHTADIHLDSPLRSLALRDPDLADLVGNATRQAFVSIIDLCIAEQVDALVIAGDLYDGDQTSMKTAAFLGAQMRRLDQAGIRVFKIRGNHDALSRITKELTFPDSVKVFGGRAEAVSVQAEGGFDVVFHGLSFSSPHAPESLLPKFKAPVEGAVNIGLMHTSLAGAPGHDLYAPCNVVDLHGAGFDYWALGHVHQRQDHAGKRTVIMPGMPQGRDINEAGEKTVTLVTIHDDHSVSMEERLTSIAQFERVAVDMTGVDDWKQMVGMIGSALESERTRTASDHLVARLSIKGATPLAWQLRRDRDLLRGEAVDRASALGRTWIEKIELDVAAPSAVGAVPTADPIVELGALIAGEVMTSAAFNAEVRAMVGDLLAQLPKESRHILGDSEADFEAGIARLIAEGSDDVLARLHEHKAGNE